MKHINLVLSLLLSLLMTTLSYSQDTFSIVAVDSITGEVGSAGASCVDLFQTSLNTNDFIGVLIPGVGAINSQAYYIPINQNNATDRMLAGDTPEEIISWLVDNDIQGLPQRRQYGIAAFINDNPVTAAHTGSNTDPYTGHILGPNYAIQGNILLNAEVLEDMEKRFLEAPGDLACKLMAAMKGAQRVGADSRCTSNASSSLFAYVKVAQSDDLQGVPSLNVGVRTRSGARIEPIDSLQTLFNLEHQCNGSSTKQTAIFDELFSLAPNPANEQLEIKSFSNDHYNIKLINSLGEMVWSDTLVNTKTIDISSYAAGNYVLQVQNGSLFVSKMVVIQH